MSKGRMLVSDWWLRQSSGHNRRERDAVRGFARQRESRSQKSEECMDKTDPLSMHISNPAQRNRRFSR